MCMILRCFYFFTASMLIIVNIANAQSTFTKNLVECATRYNIDLEARLTNNIEEAISGNAQLDLMDYLSKFPREDRLAAMSMFRECLILRYETTNSGSTIITNMPINVIPAEFPDITNNYINLSNYIDINRDNEWYYQFSVDRVCNLYIDFDNAVGFKYGFTLMTKDRSIIYNSHQGYQVPPKIIEVGPNDFIFQLKSIRDAALYKIRIEARC